MNIRKAKTADLGALVAFDTVARGLQRRIETIKQATIQGRCWVYAEGGTPMGYAIMQDDVLDHPFIQLVFVAAEHRRHGIASKLIRHIETLAQGQGREKILTSTNKSNAPMQAALATLGYRPCGEITGLDEGDPEFVYLKPLV